MTELEKLAARVEAEGPSRELGEEVLLACGWTKTPIGYFLGPLYWWSPPDGGRGFDADNFQNPLTSLDAAMTLVPEGWAWTLYSDASCEIGIEPEGGTIMRVIFTAEAPTPAAALCAAALRANQESRNEQE